MSDWRSILVGVCLVLRHVPFALAAETIRVEARPGGVVGLGASSARSFGSTSETSA